jgi:hypothetical protein
VHREQAQIVTLFATLVSARVERYHHISQKNTVESVLNLCSCLEQPLLVMLESPFWGNWSADHLNWVKACDVQVA